MRLTLACRCAPLNWSLMMLIPACQVCVAQTRSQTTTLVVNGKSGETTVLQLNGRTYVDLDSLARIANGSLAYQGHQVTLALPASGATSPATGDQAATHAGLSREFRQAAIETLARMREWASTMANAIQHGYPVDESWAGDYREKAATSLRLASTNASTDSDHNALALLTNEFQNVDTWSNEMIEARKDMATAKYTMSPDALRNEPLSQKIINCGHFLGAMLGSGDFNDDLSCH